MLATLDNSVLTKKKKTIPEILFNEIIKYINNEFIVSLIKIYYIIRWTIIFL